MASKENQQKDRMLTAAAEAAKAAPQVSGIQPIPLPCAVQVATPDVPVPVPQRDGTVKNVKDFIILQYETPAGSGILWLDPNQAEQIADGLEQAAAAQRAGIVLAK